MGPRLFLLLLTLPMAGCLPIEFTSAGLKWGDPHNRRRMVPRQNVQIRNPDVNRSRTLAELQYQEVLNNIALLEARDLRRHLAFPPGRKADEAPPLSGPVPALHHEFIYKSRSSEIPGAVEPGGRVPNLSPQRQLFLLYAYEKAIGFQQDLAIEQELEFFFKIQPRLYAALRSGWFGVGNADDVPDAISYVGRYEDVYVWVFSTFVPSLAQFTFALNHLATDVTPPPPPLHPLHPPHPLLENHDPAPLPSHPLHPVMPMLPPLSPSPDFAP